MSTKINLDIKIKERTGLSSDGRLRVTSSTQLTDPFMDEDVSDSEFKLYGVESLTSLYEKLDVVVNCNEVMPNDAAFYIEDQLFASMDDHYNLILNDEFPVSLTEKYGKRETMKFEMSIVERIPYGADSDFKGFGVERTGGTKAYHDVNAGNYISVESKNDYKDQNECKNAVINYMTKDMSSYINYADITDVVFNGEKIGTYSMGKEFKPEVPTVKKKNKRKSGSRPS